MDSWGNTVEIDHLNVPVPSGRQRQADKRASSSTTRAQEIAAADEPEYTMIRYESSCDKWHMYQKHSEKPGDGQWMTVPVGYIEGAFTSNCMCAKAAAKANPDKNIKLRFGDRNPNKRRHEATMRANLKRKLNLKMKTVMNARDMKRRRIDTIASVMAARAQRRIEEEKIRLEQMNGTRCFMVALEHLGIAIPGCICDTFDELGKYVVSPLRPSKWGWSELNLTNLYLPTLEVFVANAKPDEKYILSVRILSIYTFSQNHIYIGVLGYLKNYPPHCCCYPRSYFRR